MQRREAKARFFADLLGRAGDLRSVPNSKSLFETSDGRVRLYVRYSKRHTGDRTFYGLRRQDLQQLEGHRSFICLLWDEQAEPLLIPFERYEDLFQSVAPADDGQYKSQVFLSQEGAELYVAGTGRFNVESHFGWHEFERAIQSEESGTPPLTHAQVQTLLGAIGTAKGFQVWVPQNDRCSLDWTLVSHFDLANTLPASYSEVRSIAENVDVIWLTKGSGCLQALYEVEHSTSIYSGLLRFNDIHLIAPSLQPRFSIVADDIRRARFARQVNRPTFQASGLGELCSFLEYAEVYGWYKRLCRSR